MDPKVEYWLDLARYDLRTARVMLKGKRFLYVGFMCHQVIEKMLKGYYVHSQNAMPPYTHNLHYLAEKSGIYDRMTEAQKNLIDQLEPLNVEARYPTYKKQLLQSLDEKTCQTILKQTRELSRWIKAQLSIT